MKYFLNTKVNKPTKAMDKIPALKLTVVLKTQNNNIGKAKIGIITTNWVALVP